MKKMAINDNNKISKVNLNTEYTQQQVLIMGSQAMMSSGQPINIDALNAVFAMQGKIEKLNAEKSFNEALCKLQGEIAPITPDREVNFSASGGRVQYKTATISHILKSIQKNLLDNGFSLIHNYIHDEYSVETILSHKDGHNKSIKLKMLGQFGKISGMQLAQSQITYAKRTNMINLINLPIKDEFDNDDEDLTKNADKAAKEADAQRIKERAMDKILLDKVIEQVQKNMEVLQKRKTITDTMRIFRGKLDDQIELVTLRGSVEDKTIFFGFIDSFDEKENNSKAETLTEIPLGD